MISRIRSLSEVDIISPTCNHFSEQFEIDNVRIFISYELYLPYVKDFLIHLSEAKPHKNKYYGQYKVFKVKITDTGITISGSLSNYYAGKTGILHYNLLKPAIAKLGEELKLDLLKARLYRVDINWNVITNRPVEIYNKKLFLELSRFKRVEQVDGVRFQTLQKSLVIYNKSLELKDKKCKAEIAENWLRVEFKIFKDVKDIAGLTWVEDLMNPSAFLILMEMLKYYYFKVERKKTSITHLKDLNNSKDYYDLLMLQGCEARGGVDAVFQEVEDLMTIGVLNNRKQKYELKKKIKGLLRFQIDSTKNPLIKELDTKFLSNFEKTSDFLLKMSKKQIKKEV